MSLQKTLPFPPSKNPGETFAGWATESRQLSASVRQMLAHRTCESGGGCWLTTPTAATYGTNQSLGKNAKVRPSLETMARHDLFPTPTANCGTGAGSNGRKGGLNLQTAVARLPTPRASDGGRITATECTRNRVSKGIASLPETVVESLRLPTPTARDWKSGKASAATHARNSRPLSEQVGGQLNPTFVEWMMGWPIGWSVCEHWATVKSRNARRKRGEF